jgi:hypothetical protein
MKTKTENSWNKEKVEQFNEDQCKINFSLLWGDKKIIALEREAWGKRKSKENRWLKSTR